MRLLELVAEGIPGLPARARLELGAGHVLLPSGSPLGPLFLDLLYPHQPPAWKVPKEGDCRAALTLRLREGGTYRIIRDFRRGVALQRWKPETQAYEALSLPLEAGRCMVPEAPLPERASYQAFFTLGPAALPSSRPLATSQAAMPAQPQRLRELEAELANSLEVEGLQQRLDELTQESYVVADRLKRLGQAKAEAEEAAAAAARFQVEGLPPEPQRLLRDYEAALDAKEQAEARIQGDEEALEGLRERSGKARGLGQELKRILPLCLLGFAAMGAGLFSPWRALAFLAIPLFALPAWLAFTALGQQRNLESFGRRARLFEERRKKVQGDWERESRPLLELLAQLKLKAPEELPKWLEQREEAQALAASRAQAHQRLVEDPEIQRAAEASQRLQREIEAADDKLASLVAGSFRPVQLIREEIAGLAQAQPAAAAPSDPSARFLERAQLLLGSGGEAPSQLVAKASAHLAALSGGNWTGLSFGEGGGLLVTGAGGSQGWGELQGKEQDLLWVALLLSVMEAQAQRRPLPILLDEPFATFEPGQRQVLARALGALGQQAQVLHCSALPEFRGQGSAP